ncbi:NAD-dependent deacylase [Pleionea sp. CnH1-48]|uniref:SIR2 family NAD-dependent protein deacylase n=1 Tax=Pleionea sp. CnH1-48 TaxID=2954494 RepID=UPI0020973BED|nr:NAD-dependent deacylase [Pleionea sp. CnH1-48]MCO7224430.1 NAD-dependent deacylase [Pleionea sp. CnH1-48]
MTESESLIKEIAQSIKNASRCVMLSGAGLSAESGIATFRQSEDSLWSQFKPEELASPEGFLRQPEVVWDWYQWRRQQVEEAQPNAAHHAIAWLQQRYPVTLVTQNVDGLLQRAGCESVLEMHGNIMKNTCFSDNCSYVADVVDTHAKLTRCPQCDEGYLRPGVVWFGEALNYKLLQQIETACLDCDLFFSIGTSSQVYPAAGLAQIAMSRGARCIEINPEMTPLSAQADGALAMAATAAFEAIKAALE